MEAGGIAVVMGAGGGIGRALVERLRQYDGVDRVIGFSRTSSPAIDLLNEASLAAAAEWAATQGTIRLVIDATGFLHDQGRRPEKSWRELDPSHLAKAFALNAIGPALIMKHLLPLLPREGKSVFATLSARVGSIGDNRLGGWYSYRASKAALNQLVRTAAIELSRRQPEAICVALHPGTVDTALSKPFRSGVPDGRLFSTEQSAATLLRVIEELGPEASGGFYAWDGSPIPW